MDRLPTKWVQLASAIAHSVELSAGRSSSLPLPSWRRHWSGQRWSPKKKFTTHVTTNLCMWVLLKVPHKPYSKIKNKTCLGWWARGPPWLSVAPPQLLEEDGTKVRHWPRGHFSTAKVCLAATSRKWLSQRMTIAWDLQVWCLNFLSNSTHSLELILRI